VERFFGKDPVARRLYERVRAVVERLGDAEVRVGRSQIGFRRRRSFAAMWIPGRYLRGDVAPLVLTVYLPVRDGSPRWKEVVEPAPGRFTHHLELRCPDEVDEEVTAWLGQAWEAAG
jgi:Domain of unknown function (DUF5655)